MPDANTAVAPDAEVELWVRQAGKGSQHAYARLYDRFSPLVHAILLGRFRPALADDLTQECFVTAFARLSQLNESGRFGPWIAAIARRIKPPAEDSRRMVAVTDQLADNEALPEEVTEAHRMLQAVATLPEAFRDTLMMRLVEGMSGPEIAAATGMTHQSVRVNLHRGMARLRQALNLAPQPAEDEHE